MTLWSVKKKTVSFGDYVDYIDTVRNVRDYKVKYVVAICVFY